MGKTSVKTGWIAAVCLVGAFLLLFYSPVLKSPNLPIGGSPDAIKNYYAPWYHAKYDSSYIWFEGMNYPFGEHVTYTDCQPLVANTIRFVSKNITDVSDYTIGILNLLMLFSFFPTALLLWAILRKFGVDSLYAGFAGAGITLLAPQMFRIFGHFGLSYTFVVPLVWYLWLCHYDKPKMLTNIFICLSVFLVSWLHPYFLSITMILLGLLWFFRFILERRKHSIGFFVLHFTMQVILPVLLVQLAMMMSDPVTDRPGSPYGFHEYKSNLWNLVLPYGLHFFTRTIFLVSNINWEGASYLGLFSILVLIFILLRTGGRLLIPRFRRKTGPDGKVKRNFFRKIIRKIKPSLSNPISISVLAGIVLFAFACTFPFSLKPAFFMRLLPPLKQFRSMGRFAWGFYFTFVTFAFYFAWVFSRKLWQRRKKIFSAALRWLPIAILFAEATLFHIQNHSYISGEPGFLLEDKKNELPANEWIKHINPDEYSALLYLPYFHTGSENFDASSEALLTHAIRGSLYTGLPMMDLLLSRTSLSQSWMQFQATGQEYRPLEIIPWLEGKKPILIVERKDEGKNRGQALIPFAEKIYSNEEVTLYRLTAEAMKQAGKPLSLESLLKFHVPDTLYSFQGLFATAMDSTLLRNSFEQDNSEFHYAGKGSKQFPRQHEFIFYENTIPAKLGETVVFSAWSRMRKDEVGTTRWMLESRKPSGEYAIFDHMEFFRFIKVMDKEWALMERTYQAESPENKIKLSSFKWDTQPMMTEIDEFLIRKENTHLIGLVDGKFYFNNRFYPLESASFFDSLMAGKTIVPWK